MNDSANVSLYREVDVQNIPSSEILQWIHQVKFLPVEFPAEKSPLINFPLVNPPKLLIASLIHS